MLPRPTPLAAVLILAAAFAARGETPMLGAPRVAATAPLNFPTATFGGPQFWSDELVHHDWRIQQSVLTGHYRLLDGENFRRAWGTYDQCHAALEDLKRRESLPPMKGRAVVTLHGLIRSRNQMEAIGKHLEERGDYTWINVSYASTRRSLDDHAQSLARVLGNLEGIEEIDFVAHSMGNLVVRRYLGEATQSEPRWKPDPRIRRMVMIGPPNNGARMAQLFKENKLYAALTGPSGKQLACTWDECEKLLAVPDVEFGIIAGGLGTPRGANPLLPGDDDLVVSVAETKLPGARDFRVVPCLHGELISDAQVRELVFAFLERGCFTTEDDRQPIESRIAARPLTPGPSPARGEGRKAE